MTDKTTLEPNSPYSLAHSMPNDSRQAAWQEQFATHGFDNTELWNLDMSIAKFIRPRLERFLELTPTAFTDDELADLQTILKAFELIEKEALFDAEQGEIAEKGIKLLPQYFFRLWY